jgi:ATP-dependent Clp protease ATP-binding subunit ClpB
MDELRKGFRPEFLNRIDEIIVFHALTQGELTKIVEIQLNRLRERLADRKIAIHLTDAAKKHVVEVGYEPSYGARPLKRTIQKEIETPLARLLLKGDVRDGTTVEVNYDASADALVFRT